MHSQTHINWIDFHPKSSDVTPQANQDLILLIQFVCVCEGGRVCVRTHEVSVRLLMTAPVLQGPSGLMTRGNRDLGAWPLNLTCRNSRKHEDRGKTGWWTEAEYSRMIVRVTPGEPPLWKELMTAILRLISLTAATTVPYAASLKTLRHGMCTWMWDARGYQIQKFHLHSKMCLVFLIWMFELLMDFI